MDFSINQFFNRSECNEVIEFCEKIGTPFSYDLNESWDCRRVYDQDFKEFIVKKFKDLYSSNQLKLWFNLDHFNIRDTNISLTKYYESRRLDLHLDSTSQLTTVIVLSENFNDGRFILSSKPEKIHASNKINLKIGECVSFDGSKIYHGVLPVTEGIRYALNIWMTNTDFKYYKIDTSRKII